MGKVIRKRGFLWFGKAIEEWYCDECGKQLQDPFFQDEKVYCEPCANSIDLSIVHGWSSNEIVEKYHLEQFFRDTQDRKEKYIDQCYRCEALAVHIKTSSGIHQLYYQVGHKEPLKNVFKCVHHSGYDKNENVRSQADCQHSWVMVATSKIIDAESQRKYNSMMQNRNYMLEEMFGTDEIDFQYHCFGATHYWCYKCGLYRKLNPQREHLLPIRGVKNA